MNATATRVFNVIYLTGFLAHCSQESRINNVETSEGVWSDELKQRLNKHSCKTGNIHKDTTLLHKLKSGTFTELGHVKDLEVCVLQCCESKHCELALFKNNFCYGITCYSPQHCKTVPAYENDSMLAVFVTKAMRNTTKHGTQSSQSEGRKPSKKPAPFVFYPADSTSDLAFSVNLRNIAKHYVHDENVRNVLTAKADEHLTRTQHGEKRGAENRNGSRLDEFLSRNNASSSQYSRTVQSEKRSGTIPKLTNHRDTKSVEWGPRLLKAAISSSSVALLIVLLVLLAMTRRHQKHQK